jgi:hypothetical protein
VLARKKLYHLGHIPSLCCVIFAIGSCFIPGLAWTWILLFVLPHTVEMTGVCQCGQLLVKIWSCKLFPGAGIFLNLASQVARIIGLHIYIGKGFHPLLSYFSKPFLVCAAFWSKKFDITWHLFKYWFRLKSILYILYIVIEQLTLWSPTHSIHNVTKCDWIFLMPSSNSL